MNLKKFPRSTLPRRRVTEPSSTHYGDPRLLGVDVSPCHTRFLVGSGVCLIGVWRYLRKGQVGRKCLVLPNVETVALPLVASQSEA